MLPETSIVPADEVLELVRHHRLARSGVGWVDVNLLASALTASARLWTLDGALGKAAARLGCAFSPR